MNIKIYTIDINITIDFNANYSFHKASDFQ